ncbi:MAG: type II toxin-antitoxin system VapC family toxin [Alphaproteobacteria bacterium]|nr:type II toxin-antitoxin system VapC family toxin [Alphaproteobacteria bacterium]
MYLLDTVSLSQTIKRRPDAHYSAWFARQDAVSLFVSVLTLGEVYKGIVRQLSGDPRHARDLQAWLNKSRSDFAGRILDVTEPVALRWGELVASGPTLPMIDTLIAATALVHGFSVVTRNVRDFERAGVAVINPFD